MFDEKYIMTGIFSMALIAAWQKPSLFKDHIVNKIMVLSVAAFLLLGVWEAALQVSIDVLPSSLNEAQLAESKKNIEAVSIPTSWWVFNFIMYVFVFVLDWLAGVSQAHENKN
jgi:hypothetical protein